MHEYAQVLYRRVMGQSRRNKSWTEDAIRRFSSECFEKAPTCNCGCGEKTLPNVTANNMSIGKWVTAWQNGRDIVFYDSIKDHLYPNRVTEEERQAILSSLLGDGYMNYPHNGSSAPRLNWNMGNEDHAKYKYNFFKRFGSEYNEEENTGWGSRWYRVRTGCALAFIDIYNKYRVDCKVQRASLIIPELTEIGWAWLYGDDGHLNKEDQSMYIHTEGLGEEGSKIVANGVSSFLGMKKAASVYMYRGGTPKRKRFMVRIKKNESIEFSKRIKKHMANGMEYKLCRVHRDS